MNVGQFQSRLALVTAEFTFMQDFPVFIYLYGYLIIQQITVLAFVNFESGIDHQIPVLADSFFNTSCVL